MSESTIREAINIVPIEGVLKEKNLEVKTNDGKTAIMGTISIETGENSIHTVKIFVNEKTKEGKDNGSYKGMKTVMDEYVSVAEGILNGLTEQEAKENASQVVVNKGKLGLNEYYLNGELKSYPQITTNFVNRVKGAFSPRAEFELEMFFSKMNKEIKDGEETGRLIVEGIVPLYGGKVVPIQFVAEGEVANYLDTNYETGKTGKIWGELVNTIEVKVERNSGFGKAQEKKIVNTKHELLITGGEETQYDNEEKVFTVDQIKKAMAERAVALDELLKKSQENNNQSNNKGNKKSSGSSTKQEFKF